jgi:hypothetical protein
MKFSDVMAYYDYKMINICKALHVARDTVKAWKENDKIPFKMQCVLEVMSNGKLKADKSKPEE